VQQWRGVEVHSQAGVGERTFKRVVSGSSQGRGGNLVQNRE
jgi:hypothetical protein